MKLDVKKFFKPQSDITVYELAVIVANLPPEPARGTWFTADAWAALDDNIKRHFRDG